MKDTDIGLANKKCRPCQGNTPTLPPKDIRILLDKLNQGWALNHQGHLYKDYTFADFMEAVRFANQIAQISEQEGHHPNLTIAWGICEVEIWTHKISGLSESDFILAAKIDQIHA